MITAEILKGRKMEFAAHYNGGREWFGYLFRCSDFPRLTKLEKSIRKTRTTDVIWHVDGKACATFAEAIERLNVPAVFDDLEQRALDVVPIEFKRARDVERDIGTALCNPGAPEAVVKSTGLRLVWALAEKGALEYGKDPNRPDGEPWSDIVPEHLRFTPLIRRRLDSDVASRAG